MESSRRALAIQMILQQGWIRNVEWMDEVDSTSSEARRAIGSSTIPQLPSLFVAETQTRGRGRNNHQWYSPAGCLMLTLVLPTSELAEPQARWGQLALVCGVAVGDTASRFTSSASVQQKWPNDLYLDGKKCAGILIESMGLVGQRQSGVSIDGQSGAHSIQEQAWLIGIGINVDVDWEASPEELKQRSTCLQSASREVGTFSPERIDKAAVLIDLMDSLRQNLNDWRSGDSSWWQRWNERCLLTGRKVTVDRGERPQCGDCLGATVDGRLIVRWDASGEVEELASAQILEWT